MRSFLLVCSLALCIAKTQELSTVNLDSTNRFTISAGETKKLSIDSNPTTGYYWNVVETGYELCTVISQGYTSYPHKEGMTGVGGLQTFDLSCDQDAEVGSSHNLKLEYKRSWEPEAIGTKQTTYTVTSS